MGSINQVIIVGSEEGMITNEPARLSYSDASNMKLPEPSNKLKSA